MVARAGAGRARTGLARIVAILRRYVWNRATLMAILLTSPAILTAMGSFVMTRWVDAEIAALT